MIRLGLNLRVFVIQTEVKIVLVPAADGLFREISKQIKYFQRK
jgi:hypothetical protein